MGPTASPTDAGGPRASDRDRSSDEPAEPRAEGDPSSEVSGATGAATDRPRSLSRDRSPDRRLAVAGAIAGATALVAALAAGLLPGGAPSAGWLPLHLALALGAGLAIAGVMPFFATSFAAAPPARTGLRVLALVAIGAGALIATAAVPRGETQAAALGTLTFALGVGLVAWTAFGSLRARRRRLDRPVYVAYAAGLADVIAGVLLVAVALAGWPPLVAGWAAMRAAHAWLNLLGFVSLVIAGTLLHLLPTVLGGRIGVGRPWRATAVTGLALGAPLVAVGMLLGADVVAEIGALCALGGAGALGVVTLLALRTRGRWTTDAGWHRFVGGTLLSAVAWFGVASVLAAAPVLELGADPAAWSLARVAGPLVAGWVGLAILGAASHLLPSIGPGDPVAHGRQRRLLGRWVWLRLAALEGGVALLALGLPAGSGASGPPGSGSGAAVLPGVDQPTPEAAVAGGWALVGVGALLTVALLALALVDGVRSERGGLARR